MSDSEFEILLVEDNQGDVRLTVEALRATGVACHLSAVSDGDAALRFLRREGDQTGAPVPDLILLDLNLPVRDGREVLAQVKADPELRRIPVIVLTSSEAERDVRAAYEGGANCCVTKPLHLDEFLRVVGAITDFWLGVARLPGA